MPPAQEPQGITLSHLTTCRQANGNFIMMLVLELSLGILKGSQWVYREEGV